ncbi:hypothetical protein ACTI_37900 [Actinoplanes sp. OR16]|uniref:SAF domain-containing protein n=1 Tax=Actinoplanes sp. OR16 TaxID=946334 RepID=UPI000F70F7A6|nr:SAF domain-containing protein [Actinoplanes sp. OR16]BBH67105.1 hypothetical protein ACTI_37900 [Actinoplanes sp. OR16]
MTTTPTSAPPQLTAAVAIPKVAPQRRWRPMLVWLGVAMIAIGGLIGWRLLATVGSTAEYLAVSQRVEAGSEITVDKLTKVRITTDPALRPIKAADASAVIGKYATVGLVAGTLLTEAQLTDEPVPGPGRQLVGISLGEERVPSKRIVPGDTVRLIITNDDSPSAANPARKAEPAPEIVTAVVVDVRDGVKEGSTLLNVAVPNRDAAMVAARAADERIVVSLSSGR